MNVREAGVNVIPLPDCAIAHRRWAGCAARWIIREVSETVPTGVSLPVTLATVMPLWSESVLEAAWVTVMSSLTELASSPPVTVKACADTHFVVAAVRPEGLMPRVQCFGRGH